MAFRVPTSLRRPAWLLTALILAGLLASGVLLEPSTRARAQEPAIPPAAVAALRDGRSLHATRLIRAWLRARPDTSAATILQLARAEAGWSDWAAVEALLRDRPWLDRQEQAAGRELLARSRLVRGAWAAAASDFARYLDAAGRLSDHDRGLVLVRWAEALQKADSTGNEAAALQTYDEAARRLPAVAGRIRWLAVGAAAAAGDTAGLRARLAALPAAERRDDAWRLRVRAATLAGDPGAARAAAEAAAGSLPGAYARAVAWAAAGGLRLQAGDSAGARAAYDEALRLAPASSAGTGSARMLLELNGLSAAQELRAARALLAAGDVAHGEPALRRYLAAARPSAARRAELLRELGRGQFAAGRYTAAARTLRSALGGASAEIAAAALYTAARAEYRAGQQQTARSTLARVAERYPRASATAAALFLLADLDQDDGRNTSARNNFRRVTRLRGPADIVGKAYMRLGGLEFAAREYATATGTYLDYLERYPGGEYAEQASFWIARADLHRERTTRAHERLERIRRAGSLSYYALRAATLLHEPMVVAGPGPAVAGARRADIAAGVQRMRLLRDLGLEDEARAVARDLESSLAGDDGALYQLAEELDVGGFPTAAIGVGLRLRRAAGAWNERLLRIVYPLPYRAALEAEAAARDLDPWLVAGLIRQESDFSASARSPAGAVGLMQVMPATGRTLARALDLPRPDEAMLAQPEVNLELGTAFVADLLRQADDRVPRMLAAYNAGPARLERWRRFPEARDADLFAERIPFDETREYVKVVQANARIYRELYPELRAGAAGD